MTAPNPNPEPARCTAKLDNGDGVVIQCTKPQGHSWFHGAAPHEWSDQEYGAIPEDEVPAAASATTADDSSTRLDHWVARAKTAEAALAARDAELRRAYEVIGSVASDLSELLPDDNDRILGDTVLSVILRSVDELNGVAL